MDALQSQFNQHLQRAGKEAIINGVSYLCFFNEIDNKDKSIDTKYMFIGKDTGIQIEQGMIIDSLNCKWMIISYDENYNEVYYKFEVRKCNYTIKFAINSMYLKSFATCIDGQSFSIDQGIISIPTGTINVTLQNNSDTNSIKLNDRFISMGSAWKISGIDKTKSGLIILTATLDAKADGDDLINEIPTGYIRPNITITNANPSSVTIGIPLQINITISQGSTILNNTPVSYSSSNSDIATIDNNGLVTGIIEGSTIITAVLTEEPDISASITVNAVYTVVHNYSISILGSTRICQYDSSDFTATIYDNGMEVTDKTITWSLLNSTGTAPLDSSIGTLTNVIGNSCTVNNLKLNNHGILKVVLNDDNSISLSVNLTFVGAF